MRTLYFIFGLILISSCESKGVEKTDKKNSQYYVDDNMPERIEVGTVLEIETLFDQTEFSYSESKKLLQELNICEEQLQEKKSCADCIPKYFKFFELNNSLKISNSFLLQIRANTILKTDKTKRLPSRHLLAFEREAGELILVNGFRGNLIEKRTTALNYDDLLIRFFIAKENTFFNCLFTWKDNKYQFKSVESIDESGRGGAVLPAYKDSMSLVVFNVLKENQMLF